MDMIGQLFDSDLFWTVATIITFAVGGAWYAYSGYRKHKGEQWDWSKAKYPIGFASALGAVAGVLTLSLGGDLGGPIFGAAMMMLAVVADQGRQMIQAGHNTFEELVEKGVEPSEAVVRATIDGANEGDLEKVMGVVDEFVTQHGQPDRETVEDRADDVRETVEDEGVGEAAEEIAPEKTPVHTEPAHRAEGLPDESSEDDGEDGTDRAKHDSNHYVSDAP